MSASQAYATSQENSHYTKTLWQENAVSLEMSLKLIINFTGKWDFSGNDVQAISPNCVFCKN